MGPAIRSGAAPEQPEHAARGVAAAHELFRRGKLDQAEAACRNLLSQGNANADLYALLGMVIIQKGDPTGSIPYFKNAVALEPGTARLHNNLGIACKRAGQTDDAEAAYRRAISIDDTYPQAHNNLGVVLVERRDYSDAVRNFKKAVELDAKFIEARRNLARALSESAKFDEAVCELQYILKSTPNDTHARLSLAFVSRQLGDYVDAHACLDRILEGDPNHIDALFQRGLVFQAQGRISEARDVLARVVDTNPEHAAAQNIFGVVLQALGDLDGAVNRFRLAVSMQPDFAEAHRNLAMARRHVEIDDDVRRTQQCAETASDEASAMHLEFALAKIYDDLGQLDDAFAHLFRANRLKRRSIQYDVGQDRIFFANLKRTFGSKFFSHRADWGVNDTTPIFIVGLPRSGTTLVEQIIASHSRAWGAGEILDLDRLLWNVGGSDPIQDWCAAMDSLTQSEVSDLANAYLDSLKRGSPGVDRISDKTPGNFHYVGMIRAMLPRAKIIHCVRDALDTCFSCYQNYFTHDVSFAYELSELGTYYRLYSDLIDHWRTELPGFIYDLNYETLLQDQETETRNLLQFCDLDWEPACLDFHRTDRPVHTASVVQVRQPIYRSSVGRAARYEMHLGPLIEALGTLA